MDLSQLWEAADKAGVIALLIVMIVGGLRGWWVFGRQYEELREDRDQWKEMALTGTRLAEVSVPKMQDTHLDLLLQALSNELAKKNE